MKIILKSILFLFVCLMMCVSCNDLKDDGQRGFLCNATVVGDSIGGYYCYLDGGGLVISYDRILDGIERGYLGFLYTENDWTTSASGVQYINNSHIGAGTFYDIVHPMTVEEANSKHITDADSCSVPTHVNINRVYYGFLDLHGDFDIFNRNTAETVASKLNVVYDPSEQTPDNLKLQLCVNRRVPNGWTLISYDFRAVSCDISSLSSIQQWQDSLNVEVRVDKNHKYTTRMSKKDFQKPTPILLK